MKRISIILLAVGLVAALSVPVFALDVKVTGRAEMTGYWESNRAMVDNNEASQRYFTTFVRIEPVFKVAEGLQLVTRFEGLERVAGLDRMGYEQWHRMAPAGWAAGAALSGASMMDRNSENEQNFAMKRAYIDAKILGGQWWVGYQQGGNFGTDFMDYYEDVLRVKAHYLLVPSRSSPSGKRRVRTAWAPTVTATPQGINTRSPRRTSGPAARSALSFNGTGIMTKNKRTSHPYKQNYYLLCPWFKATFGPVYVEGEINYYFGKAYDYNDPSTIEDKDYDSFNYYLMGKYTFGPAYVGAQIARVQGQDPTKADELNTPGAPSDQAHMVYQPTLVLWNDWTNRWTKQGFGTNGIIGNNNAYWVNNVQLYQIMAGYKPFDKLSFDVTFAVAVADEHPVGYVDDDYGNELDLYATYKLYDNLAYTIAFGYLWAGDYWKGTNANAQVGDDWLLMHKLTLTF